MIACQLGDFCKDLPPLKVPLWGAGGGLGLQHMDLGEGDTMQTIARCCLLEWKGVWDRDSVDCMHGVAAGSAGGGGLLQPGLPASGSRSTQAARRRVKLKIGRRDVRSSEFRALRLDFCDRGLSPSWDSEDRRCGDVCCGSFTDVHSRCPPPPSRGASRLLLSLRCCFN